MELLSKFSTKVVEILKAANNFVVDPMAPSGLVTPDKRMWTVLNKFDIFFSVGAQPGGFLEQLGWKREYQHMSPLGYFTHFFLEGFCYTHNGVELDDQSIWNICEVAAGLVLSPKSELLNPWLPYEDLCQELVAIASKELVTVTRTADFTGGQRVLSEVGPPATCCVASEFGRSSSGAQSDASVREHRHRSRRRRRRRKHNSALSADLPVVLGPTPMVESLGGLELDQQRVATERDVDDSWLSVFLAARGAPTFPGVLISGRDLCDEQLSEADVHTLEYLAGAIPPVLQGARVLRGESDDSRVPRLMEDFSELLDEHGFLTGPGYFAKGLLDVFCSPGLVQLDSKDIVTLLEIVACAGIEKGSAIPDLAALVC